MPNPHPPHLYLDVFSGISGDMFLGALIDLGVPIEHVEAELAKLNVPGYHLHCHRGQKSGISGVKFDVHVHGEPASHDHDHDHSHEHGHSHSHSPGQDHAHAHDHGHGNGHGHHHHPHHGHEHEHIHTHAHEPDPSHGHADHLGQRDFAQIRALIAASSLSEWVRSRAIAVFHRIAVAEGRIHDRPPEEVHFHEVGAIDSIVDVVGACVALEALGCPRVTASSVVEGTGFVRCAHGRMPLPAPATLEILAVRGIAITQCDEPSELVTPTGAALLAEFSESFGPLPAFAAKRVGYGLGTRDNRTRPNVLRALLGEIQGPAPQAAHDWEADTVAVLEANLDDLSPEVLGHFVERALAEGALDVFHTAVQMKKNRPGTLLSVLVRVGDSDRFARLILSETSAFGVRQTLATRRKLRREFRDVDTTYGKVRVKLGYLDGALLHATPEYEECRRIAASAAVPLREVLAAAASAARGLRP
ncbi:MAG: nickel pincer cofactor biosynthesis protein LarC [Limisphaerales bacterium]